MGEQNFHAELQTNALVLLHLIGALLLGLMVGYERSYHGRAAGMEYRSFYY